jgi:V/A-type H+-transporting ATPase subunit B
MNLGIGAAHTREDHKKVSDQCYAAYAEGNDLRGLVAIVGKEALSERVGFMSRMAMGGYPWGAA